MSGKFITCLWRKKRLRRGFVLSHKDSSPDLAVGGRQHWGLGDPHMALSPHMHVATGSHTPCPGALQLSWGSQGSRVTKALLLSCGWGFSDPVPQPGPCCAAEAPREGTGSPRSSLPDCDTLI